MSLDFNPNEPAQIKQFFWATYIPDRANKKFKLHSNRGHALNAFHYRKDAILYKWENDKWIEIFRREDFGNSNCGLCEKELEIRRWGGFSYAKWIDKDTDFPKFINVCYECFYKKGEIVFIKIKDRGKSYRLDEYSFRYQGLLYQNKFDKFFDFPIFITFADTEEEVLIKLKSWWNNKRTSKVIEVDKNLNPV